jgi:hypothetical protein
MSEMTQDWELDESHFNAEQHNLVDELKAWDLFV